MTITLTIIAALAAAAIGHYWLTYQPAAQKYWERLPTRQQYLAAHPDCDSQQGIRCCFCGSNRLVSAG